jgi:hypothetical protein
VSDAAYLFVAEPASPQPQRILAVAARVIPNRASVGQRVLYYNRISSDERVFSHPAELMYARVRTQRGVIFDDHVTRERGSIREDYVTADAAVVCDVGLSHDEIIVADLGQVAAALGATLQSGELTKGVSFARAQPTSLASILQILRRLTGRHKRVKDRSAPELRGPFNHTVAGNSNVVVQYDIVTNDRVRPDNHVASEFRLRADDRCGVNRHFAALSYTGSTGVKAAAPLI